MKLSNPPTPSTRSAVGSRAPRANVDASPQRRATARSLAVGVVFVVLALVASACGGSSDSALEPVAFTESEEAEQLLRDGKPQSAETTVPVPETSTTTTTTLPLGEHETWVAVATPAIERVELFDAPNGNPVAFEFGVFNPTYWDTPVALRIIEGVGTDEWVKVSLAVRPNNSEAWIRTEGFETFSHNVHAEVILSSRTVRVFDGDELIAETQAVIGTDATPTPVGDFYVNDVLPRSNAGGAFGPWILSLSAFSETLDTFGGGLPVIAIHGTNNPGLVGGAHSNGCIRIPNDVVTFLAENVPLGSPVRIST